MHWIPAMSSSSIERLLVSAWLITSLIVAFATVEVPRPRA
jgi:hypothetical protein